MKRMSQRSWICLVLLLPGIVMSQESYRSFTNQKGQSIEAKPKTMSGGSVVLELKNGRVYSVSVGDLSVDDQAYLKEWEKTAPQPLPRLRLEYDSGKRDGDDKAGDYDDRAQILKPSMVVKNDDTRYSIKGGKGTVMVFGRGVTNRNELKVLFKGSFDFSLEPGQEAVFEGETTKVEYDDSNSVQHGHKYSGYLLVVQDSKGEIVMNEGSGAYAKYAESAMKFEQDDLTDRTFQKSRKSR